MGRVVESVKVAFYRFGQDRNEPGSLSHTYAETTDGDLWPMCKFGWNRSDGSSFSIFRGPPGTEGDCALCRNNIKLGRPPVTNGWLHKTKWL
jgi:hypothetical protein